MRMREIINLIENEADDPSPTFDDFMIDACSNAGVGFHFEEGGCWGMALALADFFTARGADPELLVADGNAHAMVRVDGVRYDHQGLVPSPNWARARVVDRPGLLRCAEAAGCSEDEVDDDRAVAADIVANAAEMAADGRGLDEAFHRGLVDGGATNIQTLHDLDPEHAEADERLRQHHAPDNEPDAAYDALNRYTELSGRFTRGLIAGGLKKGPATGFGPDDVRTLKDVGGFVGRARPLDDELVVYSALGFVPEGERFVSPAFISTTIDPTRAAAHANDRRRHRRGAFDVIARFHLPAGYTGGRYLGRLSRYRGEAEFLLTRGQTFAVIARHEVPIGDGESTFTRHIIDLAPIG